MTGLAYPDGTPTDGLPVLVQAIAFSFMGLVMLSLVSFSINWRRSLALPTEERGNAPLLSIDGRSIGYVLVKLRRSDSLPDESVDRKKTWLKTILSRFGSLLLLFIVFVGGFVALFAAIIAFRPSQAEIDVVVCAVMSYASTTVFFGISNWRLRTAVALDIAPETLPSRSIALLRFFPVRALVALMFFALAMLLPPQPDLGAPLFLPYFTTWAAALFLAIGWFAALETLAFVEVQRPAGLTLSGGGHQSFRTPTA